MLIPGVDQNPVAGTQGFQSTHGAQQGMLRQSALRNVAAQRKYLYLTLSCHDRRIDFDGRDPTFAACIVDFQVSDLSIPCALRNGIGILVRLVLGSPFNHAATNNLLQFAVARESNVLGVGIDDAALSVDDNISGVRGFDQTGCDARFPLSRPIWLR